MGQLYSMTWNPLRSPSRWEEKLEKPKSSTPTETSALLDDKMASKIKPTRLILTTVEEATSNIGNGDTATKNDADRKQDGNLFARGDVKDVLCKDNDNGKMLNVNNEKLLSNLGTGDTMKKIDGIDGIKNFETKNNEDNRLASEQYKCEAALVSNVEKIGDGLKPAVIIHGKEVDDKENKIAMSFLNTPNVIECSEKPALDQTVNFDRTIQPMVTEPLSNISTQRIKINPDNPMGENVCISNTEKEVEVPPKQSEHADIYSEHPDIEIDLNANSNQPPSSDLNDNSFYEAQNAACAFLEDEQGDFNQSASYDDDDDEPANACCNAPKENDENNSRDNKDDPCPGEKEEEPACCEEPKDEEPECSEEPEEPPKDCPEEPKEEECCEPEPAEECPEEEPVQECSNKLLKNLKKLSNMKINVMELSNDCTDQEKGDDPCGDDAPEEEACCPEPEEPACPEEKEEEACPDEGNDGGDEGCEEPADPCEGEKKEPATECSNKVSKNVNQSANQINQSKNNDDDDDCGCEKPKEEEACKEEPACPEEGQDDKEACPAEEPEEDCGCEPEEEEGQSAEECTNKLIKTLKKRSNQKINVIELSNDCTKQETGDDPCGDDAPEEEACCPEPEEPACSEEKEEEACPDEGNDGGDEGCEEPADPCEGEKKEPATECSNDLRKNINQSANQTNQFNNDDDDDDCGCEKQKTEEACEEKPAEACEEPKEESNDCGCDAKEEDDAGACDKDKEPVQECSNRTK